MVGRHSFPITAGRILYNVQIEEHLSYQQTQESATMWEQPSIKQLEEVVTQLSFRINWRKVQFLSFVTRGAQNN